MRLVLDITRTLEGRYDGRLTKPDTADQQDFTGILELLALLEQHLPPGEHNDAGPGESEGRTERNS